MHGLIDSHNTIQGFHFSGKPGKSENLKIGQGSHGKSGNVIQNPGKNHFCHNTSTMFLLFFCDICYLKSLTLAK